METQKYYVPSGSYNLGLQALGYIVSGIAVFFLALVYAALSAIIPLIYLNFLLTVGFGFSIAFIVTFLVKITKNRSRRSQYVMAVVIGLFANYFQWAAYIIYIDSGSVAFVDDILNNLHWILNPIVVFEIIVELNGIGLWSVFGLTPTGPELALVWAIEAFIIMGFPVWVLSKKVELPFSESKNQWYKKHTLNKKFKQLAGVFSFEKELDEIGILPAIHSLEKGDSARHSLVHLYYLEGETHQYLCVENITYENGGRGKKHRAFVVSNFKITTQDARDLLSEFPHQTNRFEF